jgi:PPE-repeat protein
VDFAGLPPEINSGRMYAGAGSGPLVAAAAAWETLAAELDAMGASYRGVVSELTGGQWVGPSSMSMAAAAAPYVSWINATATQAGQTAAQLGSAVVAYEAAFAATVPPPEIEVNRALLASLVATNILGQNTPAIAATEAQYAEMWAQDAAAMYAYAGASSAATALSPFNAPPPTTNPASTATQAAAVGQAAATAAGPSAQSALQMAAVPNALQSLASGGGSFDPVAWLHGVLTSPLGTAINDFGTPAGNDLTFLSGFTFVSCAITPFFTSLYPLALPPATAAAAADAVPDAGPAPALVGSPGSGSAGVSAGLGQAASVGQLSVPQGWTASPAIRLAATSLPTARLDAVPPAGAAGTGGFFGGLPAVGSLVNAPRGDQPRARSGPRPKVIAELPGESGRAENVSGGSTPPERSRQNVASALTECERDEIQELRKELAELATERDAAARLIKEAIL